MAKEYKAVRLSGGRIKLIDTRSSDAGEGEIPPDGKIILELGAELATLRALLRKARKCVAYDVACDHLNSDRDLLARIDAALADE
jgi:hypothetical protein